MTSNEASKIDIIDLSAEDEALLDPYDGISKDSKDPSFGVLKFPKGCVKVLRGKGANLGKISMKIEPILKVDDFAEPFDSDTPGVAVWYTIKPANGKRLTGKDVKSNKAALKLLSGIEDSPIDKSTSSADLVAMHNTGALGELLSGAEMDVEVTRWDGGLNVYASSDEG